MSTSTVIAPPFDLDEVIAFLARVAPEEVYYPEETMYCPLCALLTSNGAFHVAVDFDAFAVEAEQHSTLLITPMPPLLAELQHRWCAAAEAEQTWAGEEVQVIRAGAALRIARALADETEAGR